MSDQTPSNEESQARLAAIVDSSEDAIVSKNLDGLITSWNRAAEHMFGWTAAEAVGRHITIIIPPDRLPEEDDVLAHIRRGFALMREQLLQHVAIRKWRPTRQHASRSRCRRHESRGRRATCCRGRPWRRRSPRDQERRCRFQHRFLRRV